MNAFRLLVVLLTVVITAPFAQAQTAAAADGTFTAEQLDQLVAPIALYPDDLLSQVLMAATYPLEVVQASRWRKANPSATGSALDEAMAAQPWDPSVKSLVAFPEALKMLDGNLDWAQDLGNAVLGQQEEVMDAVQRMRAKAQSAGNLETTSQQKVVVEKETIIIQPAAPERVYVPVYSPVTVYGAAWAPVRWYYPWHAYPASYWYWGYPVARTMSFSAGFVTGALLFGGCNWNNHSFYCRSAGYGHAWYRGNTNVNVNVHGNVNWNHNPSHRHGVSYSNTTVNNRYGKYNNVNVNNRPGWNNSNNTANINRPTTLPAQRPDFNRPDNKPNINRPTTLPAQRPDINRPDNKPNINRPTTLPAQRPDSKPNINRPTTLPAQRPDINRPDNKPSVNRPSTQPAQRPNYSKPASKPSGGAFSGSNSAARDRAASARGASSSSGGKKASVSAPSRSHSSASKPRPSASKPQARSSGGGRSGGGGGGRSGGGGGGRSGRR